jgi:hypothetical protein
LFLFLFVDSSSKLKFHSTRWVEDLLLSAKIANSSRFNKASNEDTETSKIQGSTDPFVYVPINSNEERKKYRALQSHIENKLSVLSAQASLFNELAVDKNPTIQVFYSYVWALTFEPEAGANDKVCLLA